MNLTRSAWARRAAVVMFAAGGIAVPQAALAQAKLAGTWNFVPEKSTVSGVPQRYKSATMSVNDQGQMVLEGVDAAGKPVKITFNATVDGKPHPVAGMPTADTSSWTRNTDNNTSYQLLKGKAIVALGTRVLSADGKTLTFRENVYDRNSKVAGTAVIVFDNPDVQVASFTPGPNGTVIMQSPLSADETAAADALAKGNDDEAIRLFTKVIDANKQIATLYYDHAGRGVAYAKKGQHEQALADFATASKLKPDDVDIRFRLGSTRVQLRQYKEAIEDLTAVIQADPMKAQAYSLRAFSANVLGDDKSAGADYDKACALNKELCI